MSNYLLCIGLILITSCNAGDYYHQRAQARVSLMKESDSLRKAFDSTVKGLETSWVISGHYESSDTFRYPAIEDRYPASILNVTTYHSDEVDSSILSQNWFGLFKNPTGYYLKQTGIKAERIEDAVLDESGQKTGWDISTPLQDSNFVLLNSVEGLREGVIESIPLPKHQLFPEESISFTFKGEKYTLYATGDTSGYAREGNIKNYQLFLRGKVRGWQVNQMLVSHPTLEEAMVQFVFAGDLNRDGLPDLLLDTTWHYNATIPTLYLSAGNDSSHLFQIVALRMSVGC